MNQSASTVVQSSQSRGYALIAVIILFGALVIRLWNLNMQSLWHDEAWSVFSGYTPFGPMGIRSADVNAPAAYYATLGLWLRLTGDSVWAMRALSAFYGLLTVAVGMVIARRFFGFRTAILAGVLITFNPILWVFSQEIRAYVTMPLMALVLLFLLDKLITPVVHRRWWIWLPFAEFFTLYAHNLSVPIIAWLNITAVIAFVLTRQFRKLALWLAIQIGVLILYVPWLLTQRPTGTVLNNPPAINLTLVWNIWVSFFTGIKSIQSTGIYYVLTALILFFALSTVGSIGRLIFRAAQPTKPHTSTHAGVVEWVNRQKTLLLLSQVFLIPVFEVAIIYAAHIDFHPRYFIVSVPATLIAVAAGVHRPYRATARKGTRLRLVINLRKPFIRFGGILFLPWSRPSDLIGRAILIFMAMAITFLSSPIHQHDDFRAIAARYATLSANDWIVIPYGGEPTLDYYRAHMNIRAHVLEIPLHSSAQTIVNQLRATLNGAHRVEVLTWYQLPADVRGAYSCTLGAMGTQTDQYTVNGLTSVRYENLTGWDTVALGTPDQNGADFGAVRAADTGASIAGKSSVCMITAWTLQESTPQALQLSTRLITDTGTFAGQTDRALLSDQQTDTTRWQAGDTFWAFSQINYPAGIAAAAAWRPVFIVYTLPANNLMLRSATIISTPLSVPSATPAYQAVFSGFPARDLPVMNVPVKGQP